MSKDRIQLSDHFTTNRLLRFVASPIIMMIFTSVYTVVDGFFISNFAGKTAFSALNLIYPFLQAFGCLGFMVGTGGSALVAMTLGTGDKKQADNLFSMLAASTIVMGIVSTITQVGKESETARDALENILYFSALIAVNLAVMNLLPFPALDGGRILFLTVNALAAALFKRRIPAKYEAAVNFGGLVVLLGFMLLVTLQDVTKLFR